MKLTERIQKLVQDSFIRNISVLAGGNVLAQLVNILSAPVLSRLFSVEEFGVYAIFTSVYTILTVFLNGKYEMAVVVEKDDRLAGVMLKTCIRLGFLLILPAAAIFIPYLKTTELWSDKVSIAVFLLMLCVASVCGNAVHSLSHYLNRYSLYRDISASVVLYASSYTVLSIFLKVLWKAENGMLYGYAFSTVVQALFLYRAARKRTPLYTIRYSRKDTFLLLKRYVRFPLFTVISDLMNSLSAQVPVLLLTNLYGVPAAGAFGMANKIVGLPVTIMGKSCATVYLKDASKAFHNGNMEEVKKLTGEVYRRLLKMALLPLLVLTFYADYLFRWVLGENWAEAGRMAQYLSLYMIFMFVSSPVTSIWHVLKKQHVSLIVNAILLLVRVGSILLGFWLFKDIFMVIPLFSLTGAVVRIGLNCYNMKLVGISPWKTLLQTGKAFALTAIAVGFPRLILFLIMGTQAF